jgi:phenylpropionate dioxygenase-like ring-hydroxylating dioxygenase large terminal subunit
MSTDMKLVEPATALPPVPRPIEDGWTLPATWYSNPRVLQLERESIFSSTWQYAGPLEHLAEPGSYFASVAGHIPVVVTKAADGELRAFVNVCRHRGHLVAEGMGCRETLQCRYHAWTYGLDGTLRRAPRSEREPGFDASVLSLLPVAVEAWGPFVFVNPDVEAAPLRETLGDLPDVVAGGHIDLTRLRFHSHQEWSQDVNWKVALENYLECYHCPVAHPGFSKVIDVDPDAYRLSVEGFVSSQIGPVRESAVGPQAKGYDASGDVPASQYHFVWPNTTINVAPGPLNLSIERWVPVDAHRTVEVTDYFFGVDVTEERIQEVIEFDTQVAVEDVALVEAVQKGLDSGAVPQGRLMAESEQLVAAFQRRVFESLIAHMS